MRPFAIRLALVPLLAVAIAPSVGRAQGAVIDQVRWLAGCWEVSSGARRVIERWAPPDSGAMVGSSRTFINGAPRGSERLRLFARGDTLVYAADPSGQRPTEFASTSVTEREVVFENPAHDFPQRIVYTRAGADSVIARIEGDRAGRRASLSFPFRRIACSPDLPGAAAGAAGDERVAGEGLLRAQRDHGVDRAGPARGNPRRD